MQFVPGSTLTQFGIKGTNYCGPGYSDGKLGGGVSGDGKTTGRVDDLCQKHDGAYDAAKNSSTPAADRLAADSQLLKDTYALMRAGALSSSEMEIAAAMMAAFLAKQQLYNIPVAATEVAGKLLKELLDALGIDDDNPLVVDFDPATSLRYRDIAKGTNTGYVPSRSAIPIPIRYDPLVLDLDGDGIESVGIDAANPILFDHTGTGIKTATGWVKSDDAYLVLDHNGNGSIDSGAELFSDATPLDAGGIAADGFAALAQEDSNGDGTISATDARWAELRLWRDLNQDGLAQNDERFTVLGHWAGNLCLATPATRMTILGAKTPLDQNPKHIRSKTLQAQRVGMSNHRHLNRGWK